MPEPIKAIDVPQEDQLPNNILADLERLLQDMIQEHDFQPENLYLARTKRSEMAKAKKMAFFVYTSEAPYPCSPDEPKSNYVDKTVISLEYKKTKDIVEISSGSEIADAIPKDIPYTYKSNNQGYHYAFSSDSPIIDVCKSMIEFKLKSYTSSATTFGCCSRFNECSDAKKCVHVNKLYAMACTYRSFLDQGIIFYGKNRNVDENGQKIEESKPETPEIRPVVEVKGGAISIGFGTGAQSEKPVGRINKGRSIVNFPDEFIVIDIETTGLSPEWDDIIEVSGVRYSKSFEEIDKFSELVKPAAQRDIDGNIYYVDDFISSLTGITNEMLANARPTEKVIPEFLNYLGDAFIVGYNVHFDINFLYDNAEYLDLKPFDNNFMDVMRLARRLYPKMEHHRLQDMATVYDVDVTGAHRSLKDCYITAEVYRNLYNLALMTYGTEEDAIKQFRSHQGKVHPKLKASDIIANVDPESIDKENPLYGKTVVFTGALERFERKYAMQLVCNLGGIPGDSVTRKTNYLVLGNNDYCSTIKDGKSTKQKKAEELKLAGLDIDIIPENVFYDMIENSESEDE